MGGRRWQAGRFALDLSSPRVMGIVNVTPDSFSDGRPGLAPAEAIARCERLVRDGAELIDIGGESSRPGAGRIDADEELRRVLPVLREALRLGVPVSVDTTKAEVMRAALDAGADIVNDVEALREAGALPAVAAHPACGIVLMHRRGDAKTMAAFADYDDPVAEVGDFLRDRVRACERAGIDRDRIAVDPGIGFAKTPAVNLELLERQRDLIARVGAGDAPVPLLVGWSRKSTLARLVGVAGRPPEARSDAERAALDAASVQVALLAVERGARVVRVHDVAGTVAALRVWRAASGRLDATQRSALR